MISIEEVIVMVVRKMKIYLDNAATTQVDEKVVKEMIPYFSKVYGNASSLHIEGSEAKRALSNSRKIIADSLNSKSDEIYFTSGGTESNNWALKGLFWQNYPQKNHIITTKIEHDCILNTCKWLEKQGAKLTYLDVDSEGFVNLKDLEKEITSQTFLISIIHGNNEIGTIQDIKSIGEIARKKNVLFHTDACQSYTKIPIDVKKDNLDLVTINSHKIHGPKGVGALYIKEGIKIQPLMHGGGHERKQRSGTENIPGIVGFSKVVKIVKEKDYIKMEKLRDKLIQGILKNIPNSKLNGPSGEKRLQNNVNITFHDVEGEAVGGYLENKGIYVSTGSACMSNTMSGSHVLKALGLNEREQNSAIRLSLSKYTTEKEIDYVIKNLPDIIRKLRKLSVLLK